MAGNMTVSVVRDSLGGNWELHTIPPVVECGIYYQAHILDRLMESHAPSYRLSFEEKGASMEP